MGALADELLKNGLVTTEHAARVERTKAVNEVLDEDERRTQREKKLRKELKALLKGDDRGAIAERIEQLSEEYYDVFDQVATEFSFSLNLGR
jgi:uncharacterized protein YaiL (DUF2058 family)